MPNLFYSKTLQHVFPLFLIFSSSSSQCVFSLFPPLRSKSPLQSLEPSLELEPPLCLRRLLICTSLHIYIYNVCVFIMPLMLALVFQSLSLCSWCSHCFFGVFHRALDLCIVFSESFILLLMLALLFQNIFIFSLFLITLNVQFDSITHDQFRSIGSN